MVALSVRPRTSLTDLLDAVEEDLAAGVVKLRPESLLLRRVGLTIVITSKTDVRCQCRRFNTNSCVGKFFTPVCVSEKSEFGAGVWLWEMSRAVGVSGVCLGGLWGGSVECCSGMRIDVEEEEQKRVPFLGKSGVCKRGTVCTW
jgi:hypothetical protein